MAELQNVELEKSSIACVLEDNNKVDDLIENVKADFYTNSICRQAFKWIKTRYMANKSISLVKMKTESDIKIEKIIEDNVIMRDFTDIIDTLEKLTIRRQIADAARDVYKITQKDDLDAEDYQNQAQEIIFNVTDTNKKEKGIYHIEDSLHKLYEKITSIQEGEFEFTGIPTGYPSIDNQISGLQNGHLTVVAAPTSMGKTAFALSICYNVIKEGYNVIFISLEMVHTEISERLAVIDSRVPANKYQKKMASYQLDNVNAAFSRLADKNLYISDKRGLSASDIKARCRKITKKMGEVDFVVVDYLQNIEYGGGRKNTAEKIGDTVLNIRNLAGELDAPIMLLSQVNRNRDGVPNLSDMRGSGEIEENADEVWIPYRPEYDEDTNNEGGKEEAKLVMKKGRTSGTGVVDFVWYPQILYWRDAFIEGKEGGLDIMD